MKTIIQVNCIDQDMEIVVDPLVASGGIHENFVAFSFCEKWEGLTKTGVFYRDAKNIVPFYSILDASNVCEIPHEVTDNAGVIYFGVFGTLGGIIKTSKVIPYKIKQGALTSDLVPTDPSPDVWEQLLKAYNDVLAGVEESNHQQAQFIGEANKAVNNCNTAAAECRDAVAILNYRASDIDGGDPSIDEVVLDTNDMDGGTPY